MFGAMEFTLNAPGSSLSILAKLQMGISHVRDVSQSVRRNNLRWTRNQSPERALSLGWIGGRLNWPGN